MRKVVAYQLMALDGVAEEPGDWMFGVADVQPFADFINRAPKHVFTSRPLTEGWSGATAVGGPAADHVRRLKQDGGADIGIHGSIGLTRSLLRAGLVDELRLAVSPATAGHGRRLFDDDAPLRRFELVDAGRSATGVVLLAYRTGGVPG